jgi:hypothetical protein
MGVSRVNRGFRVQYSSALGPYEGGLIFNSRVNASVIKAAAFDSTFSNALALKNMGGAYGGADFDPYNKSDTEIQVRGVLFSYHLFVFTAVDSSVHLLFSAFFVLFFFTSPLFLLLSSIVLFGFPSTLPCVYFISFLFLYSILLEILSILYDRAF